MATLAPPASAATPASVWTGRALTALFALFMFGASIAPKLLGMPVAAETIEALGWPARAGKLVLGLALDRIAGHYRIG